MKLKICGEISELIRVYTLSIICACHLDFVYTIIVIVLMLFDLKSLLCYTLAIL